MDAKGVARGREVSDNEGEPGDSEAVTRQGIPNRGQGRQGRGRGKVRGALTQQGRGEKEEIINEVTESQNRGKGKRGPKGKPGQGKSSGKGPETVGEQEGETKGDTTGNEQFLDRDDFLQLLRLLKVTLPVGIIAYQVIEISKAEQSVQHAETLIQSLQDFELAFRRCPSLPSRKVKHALALKNGGNVLDLTRLIFFEKTENNKEEDIKKSHQQWETNKSNTGRGFKFWEKYMKTPISTPLMHYTTKTRSWKAAEFWTDSPWFTRGKRQNTENIKSMAFADEPSLWKEENHAKKFGMNGADEAESLKFFLGLQEIISDYKNAIYIKGNKVEYGFITGTLDFLAQVKNDLGGAKKKESKRLVIECKSTRGDMVGKLYTKTPNSQKASVNKDHEYSIQVQTYLYILDQVAKVETCLPDTTAVMIFRHYHEDFNPLRDFHWSYLQTDEELQTRIDRLRVFCQEEVLGCFLAVLNLIFQKEK